jgi:hypothetical protein
MSSFQFYRNPAWLMDSERRFGLARLSRAGFRRATALVALAAVLLGLLLLQRTQVVKVSYEVDLLRAKRAEMASQHQRLQRQVEALQSLGNAEAVARQSLGMVSADPSKVIYLARPDGEGAQALWSRVQRAFER